MTMTTAVVMSYEAIRLLLYEYHTVSNKKTQKRNFREPLRRKKCGTDDVKHRLNAHKKKGSADLVKVNLAKGVSCVYPGTPKQTKPPHKETPDAPCRETKTIVSFFFVQGKKQWRGPEVG